MNKFLKVAVLFIFGISTLQAQNTQKAKALLDEVSAKVKTYENIVIDFKYSLNNPKENINQESKGNVTLKGNLYNLNFMGITKIFDGKKIYTIVPEDEEITISKYDESDKDAV
ncbi:MAG: outer membrane lipoprotein carrier protein LolA, partial [Flavobacterium haoranii]